MTRDASITPNHNSELDQFTYELPPELIAQEPLPNRSQSRLLKLERQSGARSHHNFFQIADFLQAGDTIVLNDTKVIPARLVARRKSGGTIKLQLLKAQPGSPSIWEALVTPIKRLKVAEKLEILQADGATHEIEVVDFSIGFDGFKRLIVNLGPAQDVWRILNSSGFAPLPPYISRDYAGATVDAHTLDASSRCADLARYQTVFAREPGAVAAPTAGLHFTTELLGQLQEKGINIAYLTLHVGAGTFKPISTSVDSHKIEPEIYSIPDATAEIVNRTKADRRRVVAVGTTCMRSLESACLNGILHPTESRSTDLYVRPGHHFQIVDGMITNFHLSQSSLLVLVCAFAGRDSIMQAYCEAVEKRYRFFSYGDAMLII